MTRNSARGVSVRHAEVGRVGRDCWTLCRREIGPQTAIGLPVPNWTAMRQALNLLPACDPEEAATARSFIEEQDGISEAQRSALLAVLAVSEGGLHVCTASLSAAGRSRDDWPAPKGRITARRNPRTASGFDQTRLRTPSCLSVCRQASEIGSGGADHSRFAGWLHSIRRSSANAHGPCRYVLQTFVRLHVELVGCPQPASQRVGSGNRIHKGR